MKHLSLALSFVVACGPSLANADTCKEPIAITTPCNGVLLPPSAAEEGLKCLRVDVPKLQLDLKYLKDERASFELYHKQLLEIEQSKSAALEGQVELLIKSNVAPKWYESPAFHFAMGFVTASAVTIGITYAVNND